MSAPDLPGFTAHDLGEGLWFLTGVLPAELVWDQDRFGEVWELHPEAKHVIMLYAFRSDTSFQVWKLWVNSVANFSRCLVGSSAKHPSMAPWNLLKSWW